jgi:hypothetical protein
MEVHGKITSTEKLTTKPNLSALALVSFIASFGIARIFTSKYPEKVLTLGPSYHIHHFWYGLAMLAIGGWLGISYERPRLTRLAAILFGAGGGLIGDEVGLLLTMGNYETEITYTLVITFLAIASMLILLNRYSKAIRTEFTEFLAGHAALYIGVFVTAVSVAFITQTNNAIVSMVSSLAAASGIIIALAAYLIRRIKTKP